MTLHNLILILSLVCFCIAAFALLATPRVNLIAAGLALFILSMFVTGCTTTRTNPDGTTTSSNSFTDWLANPANAALIAQIEAAAFNAAVGALTHLGAAPGGSATDKVTAELSKAYPNVPAGALRRVATHAVNKASHATR